MMGEGGREEREICYIGNTNSAALQLHVGGEGAHLDIKHSLGIEREGEREVERERSII